MLVIEDEREIADLLTQVLTEAGYAVTAIGAAVGAMTTVRALEPCVVLLDLGLPYRSGASLLAELKADPATADTPVIVVSSMPEFLTAERRALAAGIIQKPFDVQELVDTVRSSRRAGRAAQPTDAGDGTAAPAGRMRPAHRRATKGGPVRAAGPVRR